MERSRSSDDSEPIVAEEDAGIRVTIGAKLGLVTVVIIASFALVAAIGLTRREYQNLVEAKQHTAEMELRLFTLSVFAAIEFDDAIAAQESVERLAKDPEVLEPRTARPTATRPASPSSGTRHKPTQRRSVSWHRARDPPSGRRSRPSPPPMPLRWSRRLSAPTTRPLELFG